MSCDNMADYLSYSCSLKNHWVSKGCFYNYEHVYADRFSKLDAHLLFLLTVQIFHVSSTLKNMFSLKFNICPNIAYKYYNQDVLEETAV